MSEKKFPQFISNQPQGIDSFGGSQKKIANKVSEIIKKDLLETKIIGLEGDWGSGKSNVVRIIEKKLNSEGYHTFIFDAWGNQEDLTRKSFLEQLINELFDKKFLTNSEEWQKLENQLLAKTSRSLKEKYPKVKKHWFFIMSSFVLLGILTGFYTLVLKDKEVLPIIHFGVWKTIISVYLAPFILLVIGLVNIKKEYSVARQINKDKNEKDKETQWDTLGKILYWFSGQDILTEETERIIEEDPTVLMFREYFYKIEKDISSKGKLLIVFDNLDRLDTDKVKSLWSSIHTFFAESKTQINSYIIIPYNKRELILQLGEGGVGIGFIEKSIAINFRVTPPIVTNWEMFFKDKLTLAFGEELINQSDRIELITIYDLLSEDKIINPRKIINHINELVSLYLQWEKEIKSKKIKIKYLSLFSLKKDDIIYDPYTEIPLRNYLSSLENLFPDKEELDEIIAALTFGIPREHANEVLLLREFQANLRIGDSKALLSASDHSAFSNYFNKAYYSAGFPKIVKHIDKILISLKEKLPESLMNSFWNDVADKIITYDSEFNSFTLKHENILLNIDEFKGRKVINKLIDTLISKLEDEKTKDQSNYFTQIQLLESFLIEKGIFNSKIDEFLKPVYFDAIPYLDFVNKEPSKFNSYKIDCKEENLTNYIINEDNTINIEYLLPYIKEFSIIKGKKNYKFQDIQDNVKELIENINHDQKNDLDDLLKVVKALNEKYVTLKLTDTFYSQLTLNKLDSDNIYYDAFCIGLSNFENAYRQRNFQNTLNTLNETHIENICSVIEWYLCYNDILELVTTNSNAQKYSSLKSIALKITEEPRGISKLNLDWVLANFSKIVENVFDSDPTNEGLFIKRLRSWDKSLKIKIEDIDEKLFKHFNVKNNALIDAIVIKTLEYYKSLSKDKILTSFIDKNKDYEVLTHLVGNSLIKNFSSDFYSAIDDYFKKIAKQDLVCGNYKFWDSLMDKLNKVKLKSTFTSVRDILINDRGEINEDEISFFEKGLIEYGNLIKKPDDSCLKFIIPMIKSNRNFNVFLQKNEKLIKVAESSEHIETVKGELETRIKSKEYAKNETLKSITSYLKIKPTEEESEDI
ncbi:NTPase [Dokdonia pacifica]|uniref:KAP family P-loop domain-containing protein n=1 Tax=Dokdonia pacifica TaxID=1627892 RepID=A0A239A4H9_9FLAO|nr:P-loop NTPase fold protein [Dokdonia pacifica]GGG34931.1 NTPase [Dokdonia pacifica]SNR90450.1 KAP family P-loop domain-containing protein [Dokdonia pacifica]